MVDNVKVVIEQEDGEQVTIDNWTSYEINSDFFTPTDGFSLELSDDRIDQITSKIAIGNTINIYINNTLQMVGYLDKVNLRQSRNGTSLYISGRDKFGLVCDTTTIPDIKINDTDTYATAIFKILEPFGFKQENIIGLKDIEKESDIISIHGNRKYGMNVPGKTDRAAARALKLQVNHKLKPKKNEGLMEYLSRLSKRSGWILKLFPDGEHIWVGPPIYDRTEQPVTSIINRFNGIGNNVLESSYALDWSQQPAFIVAEASGFGGKFRKNINNVVMVNDITSVGDKGILSFVQDRMIELKKSGYKLIKQNFALLESIPKELGKINKSNKQGQLRQNFIYDHESKNLDELEYFVRMTMAEFNNKYLQLNYTLDGHTNQNSIWQINTLVNVEDDTYKLNSRFWIQSRKFTKSRDGGTKTELVLRLPYVFDF